MQNNVNESEVKIVKVLLWDTWTHRPAVISVSSLVLSQTPAYAMYPWIIRHGANALYGQPVYSTLLL